jgi:hypothetical protein
MQQKVQRSLECVWTLSDRGLVCAWIEISAEASDGNCLYEVEPVMERKVA